MLAFQWITSASSVLDLGCATGYFARELRKKDCLVVGIEREVQAARQARKYCEKVYVADLESHKNLSLPHRHFDYVLLMDVLEHLRTREGLLVQIRRLIKPSGTLIISTPNIAHISIRVKLLLGNFTYEDYGILDKTHVYFFTEKTLEKELLQCGWTPERKDVSSDFGQLPVFGRFLRHIPKIWQHIITMMFPNFLGVQFVWRCKSIKAYE